MIRKNDEAHIVFEFCERNLFQEMQERSSSNKPFSESEIKNIMGQLVSAVQYIHRNNYIHRDIKPENFLIQDNTDLITPGFKMQLKLADFGLAKDLSEGNLNNQTEYISTRWYRAPELLLRSTNYTQAIDIFALGCIMAELYLGRPIFPGNSEADQITKVVSILGTPTSSDWPDGIKMAEQKGIRFPQMPPTPLSQLISNREISKEAIELLNNMLKYDAKQRYTSLQCMNHSFFSNISLNFQGTPISRSPQKFSKPIGISNNSNFQQQPSTILNQEYSSPLTNTYSISNKNSKLLKQVAIPSTKPSIGNISNITYASVDSHSLKNDPPETGKRLSIFAQQNPSTSNTISQPSLANNSQNISSFEKEFGSFNSSKPSIQKPQPPYQPGYQPSSNPTYATPQKPVDISQNKKFSSLGNSLITGGANSVPFNSKTYAPTDNLAKEFSSFNPEAPKDKPQTLNFNKPPAYQPSVYTKPQLGAVREVNRANNNSVNRVVVGESHSLNRLPTPTMPLNDYGMAEGQNLNFSGGIPLLEGVMSRRPGQGKYLGSQTNSLSRGNLNVNTGPMGGRHQF